MLAALLDGWLSGRLSGRILLLPPATPRVRDVHLLSVLGGHLTMLGDMSIMRDRPGSSDEIESRIPLTLDVVDSRD